MYPKAILIAGLALVGCSPPAQPAPAPGAIERFTSEIERGNAERKSLAVDAADARAEARAEEAKQRMAESALAREKASKAGDADR